MTETNTKNNKHFASLNISAVLFRIPALLIILILWILSSRATLPVVKGLLGFDKVQHFVAYAALAIAVGLWFSHESRLKRPRRFFLISMAAASAYGVLDEFHQSFVPGRSCDIWDWTADTLGGAAGAAAIIAAARIWESRVKVKKN